MAILSRRPLSGLRLFAVAMLVALTGCVTQPVASTAADTREALNHGYAQIHWVADKLQHIDKLLLIKQESDAVESAVDTVAQVMGDQARALEQFQQDIPALDLSDDGLPIYEQKKRFAVIRDRGLLTGTPVFGQTGIDFERSLLLSLAAVLNQQRHLLQVMRRDEPNVALRDWLEQAEAALDGSYADINTLLKERYFRVN